jgi:hypothetical protein
VQYKWNEDGRADGGFIAEEVYGIIPEATQWYTDGVFAGKVKNFNDGIIVGLLTKVVQILDLQVQSNTSRIETLEAAVFDSNFTDLTVTNNISTLNLTVTGTATITNLKVTGLTEVADLKVNGKIITAGNTPTAVLGATTTGQGSTYSIEGNDSAGTITLTTGTNTVLSPLAAGEQVAVSFNVPFGTTPRVTLTPLTATSATLDYYVTRDVNGFKLNFVTAPAANTIYSFDYQILQ